MRAMKIILLLSAMVLVCGLWTYFGMEMEMNPALFAFINLVFAVAAGSACDRWLGIRKGE